MGVDPRGSLLRIDHALDKMLNRLTAVEAQLDNLFAQRDAAKAEVGKPFPQEDELREKSARLAELNITSAGKDRKAKDEGRNWKQQRDDAVICA